MSKKNETGFQVIENATEDDVRAGDYVIWEYTLESRGATIFDGRKGIAHHRDAEGYWRAEEGAYITDGDGEGVTITIHRPITEEG